MRGGKEEDKIMGPLFPRLNVNDTDKGGPRAPPRNKMALYEQLSIPSQRSNSSAASTLPLPPYNTSTLAHSVSSSQGGAHEKSVLSPVYIPHRPAHSPEKGHSRSSDGMNLSATRMEFERKSIKHGSHRTINPTGHLVSVAECSTPFPHDVSNAKNTCGKNYDDEDDFRVPAFVHPGIVGSNNNLPATDTEQLPSFCANNPQTSCTATFNSSIQLSNSYGKPLEQINTSDIRSRKHERNNSEQKRKETPAMTEYTENSVSRLETGEKFAEQSNFAKTSSDQEPTVNVFEKSRRESTRLHQEFCSNGAMGGHRCMKDIDVVETGLCRSPNMAANNRESDLKARGSVELEDAHRNDEESEASMVDSISGLEISPDDVVGVLGPKHFWKARTAIVNQQRVFAVQVFELHRLIKVQKLIAASPHLLNEDNPYLSRSPPKVSTTNLPFQSIVRSQSHMVKQKDDSKKPNQNIECPTGKTVGVPPLLSCEDSLTRSLAGQTPRNGPSSGIPSPVPMITDNKPSAWCFQPPANQWLLPVMSPSEGLVYKPYTGPCPPPAGFMAPVYGSCGPLSLPPVAGDFMNPAYGVPAPQQLQNMGVLSGASNYFPTPFGLQVVNPLVSASAVDQVRRLGGPRHDGQSIQHSRSSCNMSNPKSEAFSGCFRKFQASKGSELHGSTGSSPCVRAQGEGRDALPLFPTAPATDDSTQRSQSYAGDDQTRVIRVVPHNAGSATESAARIFRSIQKERQQYDS